MPNHVKAIHEDLKSWCGETLENEFYFKTVEQAVLNGLHPTQTTACSICTDKIVECLTKGST